MVMDGEGIGVEKLGLQSCKISMFGGFHDVSGVDKRWLLCMMCDCEYKCGLW